MNLKPITSNLVYTLIILFLFFPFASPAIGLLLGIFVSLAGIKNSNFSKYKSLALQSSIVLMGFGMNLIQVIQTSKAGFIITAISVILTIVAGLLIGKVLKVESKTSMLISTGTAICGGSAIAAIAPIISAKDHQLSFSLIVVFILNAIALFIFPTVGHYFNLNQQTFGYWAAIAIHDTSSVVGAGAIYGAKALEVATIVKLTRALWIVPLSISIAMFNKENKNNKINFPWFIGLFIISIIVAYLLPQWQNIFVNLNWLGKKGMVIALFLIGSNLSVAEIKQAGGKSFLMGIILWFIVGISALILLTTISY